MPVNVGEAHIAAAEAICEFFVIESEKLKDRGMVQAFQTDDEMASRRKTRT